MCWQSRRAIPGCRRELNAFAFFVYLGGALGGRKGQRVHAVYDFYPCVLHSLTFKERILSHRMLLNLMRSVQRKVYGLRKLL